MDILDYEVADVTILKQEKFKAWLAKRNAVTTGISIFGEHGTLYFEKALVYYDSKKNKFGCFTKDIESHEITFPHQTTEDDHNASFQKLKSFLNSVNMDVFFGESGTIMFTYHNKTKRIFEVYLLKRMAIDVYDDINDTSDTFPIYELHPAAKPLMLSYDGMKLFKEMSTVLTADL